MKFFMPAKIPIAQLPTPIQRLMRLSAEYEGPALLTRNAYCIESGRQVS